MKEYDTSNIEQVDSARLSEETADKQMVSDVRAILETPQGKRFFTEMFSHGHIEDEFFKGNSSDAYNLGGRNFALHYWSLCKKANKKLFFQIVMEIEDD
jgi:hypothetical protein